MKKLKALMGFMTGLLVLGMALASCETSVDSRPGPAGPGTEGEPIPLAANTWADGSITSSAGGSVVWYSFNVTSGTTYYVWCNDGKEGDSSKTLDVSVSAYFGNGSSIFTGADSAWTTLLSFIANSTGTVKIKVAPYSGGDTGTFAVAYNTSGTRSGIGSVNTYTVTFAPNGGSGTAPGPETVQRGSGITLPGGDGLTRTGYIFGGWNTSAAGTGTNYSAGESFTPTDNTTLYARWSVGTENDPIPLATDIWADGIITAGASTAWYSFYATAGTMYYIWWNDSKQGDSSKTLDVSVKAYFSPLYPPGTESPIFTGVDSGWNNPQEWTGPQAFIPGSSGTVKIRVSSYSSGGTGTFAVAYSTSRARPGTQHTSVVVAGSSLDEKFSWLQINAVSGGSYILDVNANETGGAWILEYSERSNITITLRGGNSNRVISLLSGSSRMFRVGSGVTLVLDNNITLQGNSGSQPIITVWGTLRMNAGSTITGHAGGGVYVDDSGGTFTMSGGTISSNSGGGVRVNSGGTFTMSGGTISTNGGGGARVDGTFAMSGGTISGNSGGGVLVVGTFAMTGGTISSNTANSGVFVVGTFAMTGGTISGNTNSGSASGGGVCVSGPFTMTGGTISGNTTGGNGGGVYVGGPFTMNGGNIMNNTSGGNGGGVYVDETFTMNSGTISGNTANSGGGVYTVTFIMADGTITANTARNYGGGVLVNHGVFAKTGGTISGYPTNNASGNVVKTTGNVVLNNRGHAVYADTLSNPMGKETTAGPDVDLLFNYNGGASYWSGGWDVTYILTFNLNGGGGTLPGPERVRPSTTLPSGSGFTRTGYIFGGWNTSASGTGTNYNAGASYTATADATLYAKWILYYAMAQIPANTFTMGSPTGEPNRGSDETQHTVTVSSFGIGKYQVTQERYEAVMGTNPSSFKTGATTGENQNRRPVENVSWYDALVFCNKVSVLEGLTPAYSISGSTDPATWGAVPTSWNTTWNAVQIVPGSNGYRLPTEAQWEYACRAGTTTAYHTGANITDNTGWYTANSGSKTHEVGLKPANAWGLHDMHGNVYEWCWDWYGTYPGNGETDPLGAVSGSYRVLRGGSWYSNGRDLRSAFRYYDFSYLPSYRGNDIGFRLVRP